MTDLAKDVSKPEFDHICDGHVYSVKKRIFGVRKTKYGGECLTDSDEGFDLCTCSIRAYICYDSKKRSDYEQKLKSALMGKMKELDGKTFDDSARLFAKKTGWMSKYLEYELDGKGCMEIGYRNNAMTFFRNRAGIFIMPMTSYGARNNVEMMFDIFKKELDRKCGW